MASHDRPAPNPSSPMIAAATPACASPRAKLVTHTTNANTAAATTTSPGDRSEPRDGAVVSRVVRLMSASSDVPPTLRCDYPKRQLNKRLRRDGATRAPADSKTECYIGFPLRPRAFGLRYGRENILDGTLGRVARQQSPDRPGFDGIDRQRPTADAPARIGQLVVVVVAHMPNHIDHLIAALTPVVGDAGNAPTRGAGPFCRVVDLTDDRVFGPGDRGHGGDGRGDRLLAAVGMDR